MLELPPLALSVRQPWAWAIIFAGKDVENRSRGALKHLLARMKRGRICIHASTVMTRDEYEGALDVFEDAGLKEWPKPHELVRGGVIGTVEVLGVVQPGGPPSPWWMQGHGLRLAEPEPLAEPIPCLGELGYFDWTDPRCHERVERRGHFNEKRSPAALAKPLPWMKAWPNRYHPFSNAPDKIIKPAAAPLFDQEPEQ